MSISTYISRYYSKNLFVCRGGLGGRIALLAYGKWLDISKLDCTSKFAYGFQDTASLCFNIIANVEISSPIRQRNLHPRMRQIYYGSPQLMLSISSCPKAMLVICSSLGPLLPNPKLSTTSRSTNFRFLLPPFLFHTPHYQSTPPHLRVPLHSHHHKHHARAPDLHALSLKPLSAPITRMRHRMNAISQPAANGLTVLLLDMARGLLAQLRLAGTLEGDPVIRAHLA